MISQPLGSLTGRVKMKNKKRAIRRHHRERMLAKRYLQAKSYRPYTVTHQDEWDAFERR